MVVVVGKDPYDHGLTVEKDYMVTVPALTGFMNLGNKMEPCQYYELGYHATAIPM